jgi:hypothetical protein
MPVGKRASKNNLLIFSGPDFIVPLSMEGVPHKAARARVKAGKREGKRWGKM